MAKNRRQNSTRNVNNSMTTKNSKLFYAWRPNNFRRQIKINPLLNSGVKKVLTTIQNAEQNKHTKILSIKDYCDNITIQIFKKAITFIWKQERVRNVKKWYAISGASLNEIQGKILYHKKEITTLLDSAAELFQQQINIEYLGVPKWIRYEDALKGDDFLDTLPRDAVIHAEHFKKVYADEVEFIGRTDEEPTTKMVNYIHNRVVEKFTPEIAKEINKVQEALRAFNGDILKWCEVHIKTLEDALKYPDIIPFLEENKRLKVTDYLFNKFRGGTCAKGRSS